MERYFLHLHNDIDAPDEVGQEFIDNCSALDCAMRCARDIASSEVREGLLDLNHCIVCVTEHGREVGIALFDDAVRVVAVRSR